MKIDADAARELVDSLGGDMMMISNELEKLILYVGEKKRVTLGDVETMVLAAKQRSLYELPTLSQLATELARSKLWMRFFPPGKGKRPPSVTYTCWRKHFADAGDSRAQCARSTHVVGRPLAGFSRAPFAADDIIRQARRYKSKRELTRAIRLVAKTDLALRSNPPSKRMVLEKLILDLTAEPKPEPEWLQEELPV